MSSGSRRAAERSLIILAAGLLGALLAAEPTGVGVLDVVWSAAFAAAMAYAGAFASPLTMLPAGAAVSVLAGGRVGVGLAAGAVLAAAATAGQDRPSSRYTAASGGLLGLALLQRGPGSTLSVLGGGAVVVLVVCGSGWRGLSVRRRRHVRWTLGGLTAVLLLASAAGALAGLRAESDARAGIDALRDARLAATGGDLDATVAGLRQAQQAFLRAGEPLGSYGRLARLVPGLSQQIGAAATSVDTAAEAAGALRGVAASIHLDDVAVERGSVDLDAIRAAEAPLEVAVAALVDAVVRLDRVDRTGLLPPIRDALDDALEEARASASTVERAHRAVQELPSLLGGEVPTRYLVLFTSPVEARNRFGFPGAYAVLRFDDGRLSFERSGPMEDLRPPPGGYDQALIDVPDRAVPFERYGVSREWRSITLPSSGPAVADLAVQLAPQAGLGDLDGVVLADPEVLAEIVGLLGDVPVPGLDLVLTPATTVDFLVSQQYLEFPGLGQARERKDALSLVAEGMGERLSALSLPRVRDLADRFGPLVEGAHLTVAVPAEVRPLAAELLADLGLDGDFPPAGAPDVLYVGQRNNVGNKIDLFLQRTLDYEVDVAEDGSLAATLTLDLANRAPARGLPDYLIGSALADPPPPGTNRTTVLLYSRHQLVDLTVDGEPVSPPTLVDGDLLVYQVGLDLAPGQEVRIVARLQGTAPEGGYAVQAFRTALALPDAVSVRLRDERDGTSATWSGRVDAPRCTSTRRGPDGCDAPRVP